MLDIKEKTVVVVVTLPEKLSEEELSRIGNDIINAIDKKYRVSLSIN